MKWKPQRPGAPGKFAGTLGSRVDVAPHAVSVGPVLLDVRAQRVVINGWSVYLPAYEATLLMALMRNAGRVLSTTELAQAIGTDPRDHARGVRRIERLARRLGRRLLVHPSTPRLVERVGRAGYRFTLVGSVANPDC